MAKTLFVNRFDNGMAESQYNQGEGQFSVAKHFDIHTFPNRLRPYRGVEADTTGQVAIGNLLIGSDGLIYGLGGNNSNSANNVYYKSTSITDPWNLLSNSQGGGTARGYGLFVEYKKSTGARRFYVGAYTSATAGNAIYIIDPAGLVSVDSHSLSWTTYLGQGFVHPIDDVLYIPYDNKIATFDWASNTWTDVALTLPSSEIVTCIAPYQNYLAIATAPSGALAGLGSNATFVSKVYLWDRDSSLETISEVINWGTGVLRVIQEYDGVLIGISDTNGTSLLTTDLDTIEIKGYAGLTPFLIKEIPTRKQTTTNPAASINSRVNFISKGRYYFSINVVGGSTSPSYYGLWSLRKSKVSGRYAVLPEMGATNDNSETGVLAALIVGDMAQFVHTAEGTLTRSIDDTAIADSYSQTSFYESLVNPNMSPGDYYAKKQLKSVSCHYLPLPAVGSTITNFITFQYRVDGGAWTTVFTEATPGVTATERIKTASSEFTSGRHYEFRIESTGSAEILGFSYRYENLETNL